MTSPPLAGSKKWNPALRSSSSMMLAVVSDGSANTTEIEVASSDHAYNGMRARVIPGALSFRMVTMKLKAPTVVEMPRKASPSV